MNESLLGDELARQQAIDPAHSYIVQAPAGSGKTGLLVLRYLSLLCTVDHPEEVLAITFTRKAAGEMRNRILEAMESAGAGHVARNTHEVVLFATALKVLERDRELGWSLLDCPGRMRVQTIDSLCHYLVSMMPTGSNVSVNAQLQDDARELHLEAARLVLPYLEENLPWAAGAVAVALSHLDNRMDRLTDLLAQMLGQRQQWLRKEGGSDEALCERGKVERAFCRQTEYHLQKLSEGFPADLCKELIACAQFASANLTDKPAHAAHVVAMLQQLPDASAEALPDWQAIAPFLLTGTSSFGWRKSGGVNVGLGFPAADKALSAEENALRKAAKARMKDLLDSLPELPHSDQIAQLLGETGGLPPAQFADEDWAAVEALYTLLQIACVELQQVFADRGRMDHAEVMAAALRALGQEDSPTDLALVLDHRIQHMLIDEFQDTSVSQMRLVRQMLAGWEVGDGRSLFLVGDPMQSIYGFREAEVGLFLGVKDSGVGCVQPASLVLRQNFRSCSQIVEWVNRAFPRIFPEQESAAMGAITYSEADAVKEAVAGGGVLVHPFLDVADQEAQVVAELIQQARNENDQTTVAVLVRGRSHLREIIPALQVSGIGFQAVKVEPLAARPCVQDVLALTCALSHPGNRIAWLSVLRAPWCGMQLSDMHVLAGHGRRELLLSRLRDPECLAGMSEDAQMRLSRIMPLVDAAIADTLRKPLRVWIEGLWTALGGPACLRDASELADVEAYFQLLETLPQAELPDEAILLERLAELYALPDPAGDPNVQLMTLHNAKGLEFDVVIMPGLDRRTRGQDQPLLRMREISASEGQPELLVAPIRSTGSDHQPHYQLLGRMNSERERNEMARLAYVGATRARRSLHLLGCVKTKQAKNEMVLSPPAKGTLLNVFWPVLEADFQRALDARSDHELNQPSVVTSELTPLRRLPLDWQCPHPPAGLVLPVRAELQQPENPEFDWAAPLAREAGKLIHALLEFPAPLDTSAQEQARRVRWLLREMGIPQERHAQLADRAGQALQNMRNDEQAQWLFCATHTDVRCELAVSRMVRGSVSNFVIDRTFVTADGVRWIVDYKTGTHKGSGLEGFLDQEQARYAPQLENYAQCLDGLDPGRETRLALYFPLIPGWREWLPDSTPAV